MGEVVAMKMKMHVSEKAEEIIPSSKEGAERLEQALQHIDPDTVKEHFTEFGGQIEVWRVVPFLKREDNSLFSVGKEILVVFLRDKDKEGKLHLKRATLKAVSDTYTLIPHSKVMEDIERVVREAGYTPHTYVRSLGVNFRSLTVIDKTVKLENDEFQVGLIANNSYNYSSAVRVHLYLVRANAVYPLLSDVLYRKHREKEITSEDFENSLKFAQKVLEALPKLKTIRVNVREVLSEMEKVKTVKYPRDKDGKRKVVVKEVGKAVVEKVVSLVGETTDVFSLWKAVSEVVFSSKTRIDGLTLVIKRKFENQIFYLLHNFLSSLLHIGR